MDCTRSGPGLPSPRVAIPSPTSAERREELKAVYTEACACTRCPQLASTRTQVVFGAGHADADLMFVGEAPGAKEDEQGVPFVGAAGKLLGQLLGEIGLSRDEVFIANVLRCRPPGNRDPAPIEIENCQEYLWRTIELVQPRVICTLGNFSTKLLRDDPTGISKIHGQPEIRVLGRRAVRLFPIYHPAAALYTRSMLGTLQEDFARLPGLLELPPPDQPEPEAEPELHTEVVPEALTPDEVAEPELAVAPEEPPPSDDQLGLF